MDHTRQQQILALGRLGWSLRRIEAVTGVRRETVSRYLRAAGLEVRGRGRPSKGAAKAAIASAPVSTDLATSAPVGEVVSRGAETGPICAECNRSIPNIRRTAG